MSDDLVKRLMDIHEHDWRVSFLAHTSDTAKAAALRLKSLTALLKEAADVVRPFARGGNGSDYAERDRAAAFLAKLEKQ